MKGHTTTRRPGLVIAALCLAAVPALATRSAWASPPCPYAFTLSGKTDQLWKQVTNSAWKSMLGTSGWTDNGFHFYSRVRERGPESGINTPSDLESEIRKKVRDTPLTGNRHEIVLPITSSSGQPLKVLYDYDGGKASKCELVTLTY
ncbi:hypothetical protein [Pseudomonas mangiferae]|uniref:Uncharacterized protein n=1 Tax=Pseudomonas mangiferae TaxID=2593654 RepID=A0A553GX46_9PSED|nr:hypothetical protein [Pseudomonas mangiferae]TRX74066.1 hypothetical protein FM069_15090 [Pseudomonas mangiferae]